MLRAIAYSRCAVAGYLSRGAPPPGACVVFPCLRLQTEAGFFFVCRTNVKVSAIFFRIFRRFVEFDYCNRPVAVLKLLLSRLHLYAGGGNVLQNQIAPDESRTFLLVDSSILPDVYLRVVEAKRMLACGRVKNFSEAAKAVGISRSALYKYKDYVFMYHARLEDNVISIFASLEDRPGVLASFMAQMTQNGANILTINQSIPVDGVAPVSLSARLDRGLSQTRLLEALRAVDGVNEVKILSTI